MYKKKNILTVILVITLSFLGMFLNIYAEENNPESSTTEFQTNTEAAQIPQAPKKPKKDSTTKKTKPKINNKNNSSTQKKNENENNNNTNTENNEKNETEKQEEKPTQPKEEEKNLDLPNVNNSEVELNPYFSQISQNTEKKSILKTLISWGLILAGIILILKVIFSSKKAPRNHTLNKQQSKHAAIPRKGNRSKYK